jgi:hypothetical protein
MRPLGAGKRARPTRPFFAKGMETANGEILWVGKADESTSSCRRAVAVA